MKHKTWLDFFKKTLKVSGTILGLLLIIGAGLIYRAMSYDPKTYLSCINTETNEPSNIAFTDYRFYKNWDPLNEEFKESYDVIEINKKIIKARAYVKKDSNGDISLDVSKNTSGAGWVSELIWEIDRENGKQKAYFVDREDIVSDNKTCEKISKKDLPTIEIKQKF